MKPAAFTLENVFYPEVVVKANREFSFESKNEPAEPSLKFQVFKEKKGDRYQVGLELTKPATSDADSYELQAWAVGIFRVNDDIADEERLPLVMRSGPNIVYGSLRDYIASITARGPWNEYYLPAIIIDPEDFDQESQDDTSEAVD